MAGSIKPYNYRVQLRPTETMKLNKKTGRYRREIENRPDRIIQGIDISYVGETEPVYMIIGSGQRIVATIPAALVLNITAEEAVSTAIKVEK